MTRFLTASVIPAIAIAVTGYFGYYTIDGPRGLRQLKSANAALAIQGAQLSDLQKGRERLQHRIDLLAFGHADPDLVTEIARSQMLASTPDQVAVPRDR